MNEQAKLSPDQVRSLLADLPGWEASNDRLTKAFRFKDFSTAFGFMTRTAMACEQLGHHPNWYNVYGRVDVELWTHSQSGITGLDVKLAELMNRFANGLEVSG